VVGDVLRRWVAATIGHPPVAEPDEHARKTPSTRRKVVVCHLAAAAREVHDHGNDEFGFDGVEESGIGLDLVAAADRLEDHPGVAEGKDTVGDDPVLGAFDRDDVGEADHPGLCRGVMGGIGLAEQAGRGCGEHETAIAAALHLAISRLADVKRRRRDARGASDSSSRPSGLRTAAYGRCPRC
jgi:hypothetical protein